MSIWDEVAPSEDDLPGYLDAGPAAPARGTIRPQEVVAGTRKVLAAVASAAVVMAAPPGPERPLWSVPVGAAHRSGVPVRQTNGSPAIFLRMVRLPGRRLGELFERWWRADPSGAMTLGRLRLAELAGGAEAGWQLRGELCRLSRYRRVPVEIELFPVGTEFVWMTMTPRRRVLVSKRYFAAGHAALDQLTRELARAG